MNVSVPHPNTRLEALCDGVFAIALTLLVLEIRPPEAESLASTSDLWRGLQDLTPSVIAFLLSFGVIFITWAFAVTTLSWAFWLALGIRMKHG